jgi:hypothetical protein
MKIRVLHVPSCHRRTARLEPSRYSRQSYSPSSPVLLPPPTHPDLILPLLNTGGRLPSPDCAESARTPPLLNALGDSRLHACFSSSSWLWCIAHLPHLLLHLQDSSDHATGDHVPPPSSNATTPNRNTASTVPHRYSEPTPPPPCPTGHP